MRSSAIPKRAARVQARGARDRRRSAERRRRGAATAAGADGIVHAAVDYSARQRQVDAAAVDGLTTLPPRPGRFLICTSGIWVLGSAPDPVDECASRKPDRARLDGVRLTNCACCRRRPRASVRSSCPARHPVWRIARHRRAICSRTPPTASSVSSAAATTTGRSSTTAISRSSTSG